MSTVEVKEGNVVKKYDFVEEDIDTMLVISRDDSLLLKGFEIVDVLGNKKRGMIVHKKDVLAHYHHWERTYPEFMGMRCSYEETAGGIRVTVHEKPTQCVEEFTFEPHYIDRGTEWPQLEDHRWHITISPEDERLQKESAKVHHEDFEVNAHGVTPLMSKAERTRRIVAYLQERIGSQSNSMVILSCFLLGAYGYKVPHRNLSTNIDLVFDEIIPVAFEQYKANFSSDGTDFLKDLVSAVESGYDNHTVLKHTWIENGKPWRPDKKYLFFMHLKLCLKLMEVHKKNVQPYQLMDLSYMSYCIERNCEHYLEKHPVGLLPQVVCWNGKVVCKNLNRFIEKSLKELEYFKQFDKSRK